MLRRFRDRVEAGKLLAERLKTYANRPDVLVLALPRGGAPVAYKVARSLNAPLDVLIVCKLYVWHTKNWIKPQSPQRTQRP